MKTRTLESLKDICVSPLAFWFFVGSNFSPRKEKASQAAARIAGFRFANNVRKSQNVTATEACHHAADAGPYSMDKNIEC